MKYENPPRCPIHVSKIRKPFDGEGFVYTDYVFRRGMVRIYRCQVPGCSRVERAAHTEFAIVRGRGPGQWSTRMVGDRKMCRTCDNFIPGDNAHLMKTGLCTDCNRNWQARYRARKVAQIKKRQGLNLTPKDSILSRDTRINGKKEKNQANGRRAQILPASRSQRREAASQKTQPCTTPQVGGSRRTSEESGRSHSGNGHRVSSFR